MALDPANFIRQNPEFESAGIPLVKSALDDARARLSADEFVGVYDQAVALMAGHLLWNSPFGASLRIDGGSDAKSPYLIDLERLKRERIPRMAVL